MLYIDFEFEDYDLKEELKYYSDFDSDYDLEYSFYLIYSTSKYS